MAHINDPRRREMLAAVLAAGGRLDVCDWRLLGLRNDDNSRALAGYFGGCCPSMISDGRWRCLTAAGRRHAQ
jgi:hypothetical protein